MSRKLRESNPGPQFQFPSTLHYDHFKLGLKVTCMCLRRCTSRCGSMTGRANFCTWDRPWGWSGSHLQSEQSCKLKSYGMISFQKNTLNVRSECWKAMEWLLAHFLVTGLERFLVQIDLGLQAFYDRTNDQQIFFVNTSKMFHRILPLTRTCEQSKIFVNTSAK